MKSQYESDSTVAGINYVQKHPKQSVTLFPEASPVVNDYKLYFIYFNF